MRLVYKDSQKEVKVGDIVTGFRGTTYKVLSFAKPHKPSSSGKVYVKDLDENCDAEYYVSIIGAEWIEREDQA